MKLHIPEFCLYKCLLYFMVQFIVLSRKSDLILKKSILSANL